MHPKLNCASMIDALLKSQWTVVNCDFMNRMPLLVFVLCMSRGSSRVNGETAIEDHRY